jgi:DNA polymerase-1
MNSDQKHLVLIDGHHMLYRAYWAIARTLTTDDGQPINAVFGFFSMMMNILNTEEPDCLAICFDAGSKTVRHQEYDAYKDGRADTPDDFYPQVKMVLNLLQTWNMPLISHSDYEADDFLGAYAHDALKSGVHSTIVTGDKDTYQLVKEGIRIALPHKGYQAVEYISPEEVKANLGIRPDQVADYKGLCGDSSDNLPGVVGIGPKTAVQLLDAYESLENVYKHIEDIRPSVKEKLINDKDQAFMCKRLATILLDIPLPHTLEELTVAELPARQIIDEFQALKFNVLLRKFERMLQTSYGQTRFNLTGVSEGGVQASSVQQTLF